MSGKLSIVIAALAFCAQSCTGQGLLSSGLSLQGSASLGGQGGSPNFLQDGFRAIGASVGELGNQINLSTANIASAANDLGNVVAAQLRRIIEDLQVKAFAAVKTASDRVESDISSARAKTDEAIEKAKKLGQAVAPCLQARVDLKQIQNRAVDLIAGCAGERVAAARDVIRRVAGNALDAVAAGAGLRARIDAQCGTGAASVGALRCASSNIAQAVARIAVDTTNVLAQVNRAQALIVTLKMDLESCVASKAADAALAAGRVALEAVKCVQADLASSNHTLGSDDQIGVNAGLSLDLNVSSNDNSL